MKKVFKIQNLDCANCAMKLEDKIKKIKGVEEASINFMLMRLSITASDESFEEVMDEVVRVAKKYEPDTVIVRK